MNLLIPTQRNDQDTSCWIFLIILANVLLSASPRLTTLLNIVLFVFRCANVLLIFFYKQYTFVLLIFVVVSFNYPLI